MFNQQRFIIEWGTLEILTMKWEKKVVLDPSEAKNISIMICHDVACEKQGNIRPYFCMGRHKNIDSLFMSNK